MAEPSTAALPLADRLVEACLDLYGVRDARDVARYLVGLIIELVPVCDGASVQAYDSAVDSFLTLGVFGYPHFGSTLVMPAATGKFGPLLAGERPEWARTTAEVEALYDRMGDDPQERFARASRLMAGAAHRSLIVLPCRVGDRLVGGIWVEIWSASRGFTHAEFHRLELVAQVAALTLAGATVATLLEADGRMRVVELGVGGSAPAGTLPGVPAGTSPGRSRSTGPDPSAVGISAGQPPAGFTERELAVLRLMADGRTNQQIADGLFVSVNTVRTHRRNLMAKLAAHNTTEALQRARALHLIA